MKRPAAVYLVIFVISLLTVFLWSLVISSELRIYLTDDFQRLAQIYFANFFLRTVLRIFALVLPVDIFGLYLGKSWARKLTFFLMMAAILFLGRDLIKVFTFTYRAQLSGFFRDLVLVKLAVFLGACGMLYLMLRPEVGRFFGAYPSEAREVRKSSSPD